MLDILNSGMIDLYTKFAVHAGASSGGPSWLSAATDNVQSTAESYDVESAPTLLIAAFILVLIFVVASVFFAFLMNARKGASNNSKAREEAQDGYKAAGITAAVLFAGVILFFVFIGMLG